MSRLYIVLWLAVILYESVISDDYTISPQHKSLIVAMGCFWCAEASFEHYAPGVIEAVCGYAGGHNVNPTYHNHPGHYEVVLVEYDPRKTSYSVLLQYAWRNIDPFNGNGQFCDSGTSYRPAIFYADEEERKDAETVRAEILNANPLWNADNIAVKLLERPTFWKAEEYHQNYYIKNPGNYGYYKNGYGRENRLKEVWGTEVYECYHDLESSCFDTVANDNGTQVEVEVNTKGIPEGEGSILPTYIVIIIVVVVAIVICGFVFYCIGKGKGFTSNRLLNEQQSVVKEKSDDGDDVDEDVDDGVNETSDKI